MDAAAEAVTREQRLQDGDFLPFAAGWAQLRDGYLHWLAGIRNIRRNVPLASTRRNAAGCA